MQSFETYSLVCMFWLLAAYFVIFGVLFSIFYHIRAIIIIIIFRTLMKFVFKKEIFHINTTKSAFDSNEYCREFCSSLKFNKDFNTSF